LNISSYLKNSTNASVVDDALVTFSSQFVSIIFRIGIQSSMAWFLAPEGRGSYAVVYLFSTMMAVFFGFGYDVANQYHIASRKISLSESISGSLFFITISSFIAIVVGYFLVGTELQFFQKASSHSFYLSLSYIPIFMLSYNLTLTLYGLRQIRFSGFILIVHSIIQLIGIIFFVKIFDLGVGGALGALLVTDITCIMLILYYLKREYKFRVIIPRYKIFKTLLNYGVRYYFAKFSNIVNFQIGTIILAFYLPEKEIGYFAVATQLVGYIIVIPNVISNVLLPRVASDVDGCKEMISQAMRVIALVSGSLGVLLVLNSKWIIKIFFSESFLPVAPLLLILLPGVFLRCIAKLSIPYFNGTDKPEVSSLSVFIGMTVNVVSLLIFLPKFGLSAGAYSMSLGYLFSSLILLAFYYKQSKTNVFSAWRFNGGDIKGVYNIFAKFGRN